MGVTNFDVVQANQFLGPNLPDMNPFGTVYYVNSASGVGSDGNNGKSPALPFATLSAAIAAAAAGDTILVAPGSAFTLTAVITIATARLTIIGYGRGPSRPTITANFAGDGISLEAAGVWLNNFHFAAPETDEATSMINVAAAGCRISNITGIGSKTAKNFVDCITIASGADDLLLENIRLYNAVVAVNSFLSIEAAVARMAIRGFTAYGDVATAGIIDAATATSLDWENVTVAVVGTSKPAATLDSNPTGIIRQGRFSGTSTTLATNAALGSAIRLFDVLVLEETDGSKQGALIPAVDVD